MNYQPKDRIVRRKRDGGARKRRSDCRLTDEQVLAMRRGERTRWEIAQAAGVSPIAAWFALKGYTYKDLPMPEPAA